MVPVLDKNIEHSPRPGNKYRTACLDCGRFNGMIGRDDFEEHARPHVLPQGEDSDAEHIIPLEEYDYGPELAQIAERIGATSEDDLDSEGDTADDVEQPNDVEQPDDVDEDDEPEDSPTVSFATVTFECTCGEEVEADPDNPPEECPHGCGEEYIW